MTAISFNPGTYLNRFVMAHLLIEFSDCVDGAAELSDDELQHVEVYEGGPNKAKEKDSDGDVSIRPDA